MKSDIEHKPEIYSNNIEKLAESISIDKDFEEKYSQNKTWILELLKDLEKVEID